MESYQTFPIPFRFLKNEQQFKKWQWVSLEYIKARKDHRPESHFINSDAIYCENDPLSTSNFWQQRRNILDKIYYFNNFQDIEDYRLNTGKTLALLKPGKVLGLDIIPAKVPYWTEREIEKLRQYQKQAGLFDNDNDKITHHDLKKIPYDFYYRYVCNVNGDSFEYRHKIVDWEIGSLFWNCYKRYGREWEEKFKDKMEQKLPSKDLMFLMGTIHRFPDKWLIISLIYPPKERPDPINLEFQF